MVINTLGFTFVIFFSKILLSSIVKLAAIEILVTSDVKLDTEWVRFHGNIKKSHGSGLKAKEFVWKFCGLATKKLNAPGPSPVPFQSYCSCLISSGTSIIRVLDKWQLWWIWGGLDSPFFIKFTQAAVVSTAFKF